MTGFPRLAVVALLGVAVGSAADRPDPQALVDAMRKLYAESRSYRDTGIVEVDYFGEDGTRQAGDRRPFATAFLRPDRFRFDFRDESSARGDLYVIWADSEGVRSWRSIQPQVERWPSLADAVNAATGISGGSAHLMANLLLPVIGGIGPDSLAEVRVVGEEVIGEQPCWRLEARGWLSFMSESPMSFWVGKETPHLRRVSYRFDIPGAASRTTITLTPEVDVELEPGAFVFTPPHP
jgi:outer membrane lipoprotein-sorting protein